jgi:hypothetical protein
MQPLRALGLLALCAPLLAAGPRAPKAEEHRAPEGGAPATKADSRQQILSELWQRRIISSDFTEYGMQDLLLLARMRSAEDAGALVLLRRTYKGLGGLAVSYKRPGDLEPRLRLTKDGFDKYLFLRSQQAVEYFQSHDVEAKWAFQLKDEKDQKLFTPDGLLTEPGEALYNRVAANVPVRWKLPDGTVQGNRPVRPAAPPAAAPATEPAQRAEAPSETLEPEMSAPKTMGPPASQQPPSPPAAPPADAAPQNPPPQAPAQTPPPGADGPHDQP